jgi:hypothetical protein
MVTTHLSVPTAPHVVRRGRWGWRRWHSLRGVREEQVERLQAALGTMREPVVLSGDLNSTPGCAAPARLSARFADAFAEAGSGWGYTFPARRPLLRLDYVLVERSVPATHCRVVATAASDHRPVVADLRIENDTHPPEDGSPALGDGGWRTISRIEAAPCAE